MPYLRDRHVQDIIKITADAKRLLTFIKDRAEDKKAEGIVALDMRGAPSNLCDYFFICGAASTRQSKAVADGIIESLKAKGIRPWHVEGYKEGQWILLDYNSVVAHIFHNNARSFYRLERLWGDAPHVDFSKPKKRPTSCKKVSSKRRYPASSKSR